MQRACEGEKVTHSNLRKALRAAKQSAPSAEIAPARPQTVSARPEIIAFIPKAEVDGKLKPVIVQSSASEPSPSQTQSRVQLGNWYLLAKKHILFCGDTASSVFYERLPQADLAVAITDDWGHDWLIERANTLLVLPESPLKQGLIKTDPIDVF